MELGAQRAGGKTGQTSDLVVPVTKDVVKDKDAPGARRERGNGALEIHRLLDVDGSRAPIRDPDIVLVASVRLTRGTNARYAAAIAARAHEHRIERNTMQP